MRIEEATLITTDDFLDKAVLDGERVGRIDIRPEVGKGGVPRQVQLRITAGATETVAVKHSQGDWTGR